MKIISSFSGEHRFLSNFYPSPIKSGDFTYPTVEHFFQAHKFGRWTDEHREIIECNSPSKAKKLARSYPLRDKVTWDHVKVGVMLAGLRVKFMDPALAKMMEATKDHYLIEGNDWGDTFWGCIPVNGRAAIPGDQWRGMNVLGNLLMIVRERKSPGFKVPVLADLWETSR